MGKLQASMAQTGSPHCTTIGLPDYDYSGSHCSTCLPTGAWGTKRGGWTGTRWWWRGRQKLDHHEFFFVFFGSPRILNAMVKSMALGNQATGNAGFPNGKIGHMLKTSVNQEKSNNFILKWFINFLSGKVIILGKKIPKYWVFLYLFNVFALLLFLN